MDLLNREEIPLEEGGSAQINQFQLDSGAIRWSVDTQASPMTSRDVATVCARLLALSFGVAAPTAADVKFCPSPSWELPEPPAVQLEE